jgi:hypothetical protein|tara:strand:+ start:2913 stop:3143 length:231 start_codon:yes stop_codon:yes gene_type:complete
MAMYLIEKDGVRKNVSYSQYKNLVEQGWTEVAAKPVESGKIKAKPIKNAKKKVEAEEKSDILDTLHGDSLLNEADE